MTDTTPEPRSVRGARVAVLSAAGVVVVVGLAANTSYAATLAPHSPAQAAMYIALAVATCALKVALPLIGLRDAAGRARPALVALWVTALALEILWGLGFAAITRGEAARERAAVNASIETARGEAARWDAERARLVSLPAVPRPPRPAAAVAVDLVQARRDAGDCDRARRGGHVAACRRVSGLAAEHAAAVALERDASDRAEAIADATRRGDAARSAAGSRSIAPPDPGANAIGALARGAGLPVTDDAVARVFGVLLVLLLELGAVVGVYYALADRGAGARSIPVPVPAPAPIAPEPPTPADVDARVLAAVAALPADAAGARRASQRALSGSLGLAPATLSAALVRLSAQGVVTASPGPRGTVFTVRRR